MNNASFKTTFGEKIVFVLNYFIIKYFTINIFTCTTKKFHLKKSNERFSILFFDTFVFYHLKLKSK